MFKRTLIALAFVLLLPLLLVGCSLIKNTGDGGSEDGSKESIGSGNIDLNQGLGNIRYYNGQPHTLDHDIIVIHTYEETDIPHRYFVFSYANNVDVGEASFTVTCTDDNPYLYGSHTYHFEISEPEVSVSSVEEFNEYIQDPNYTSFWMGDFVVCKDEVLTVPAGTTISFSTMRNYGKIINRSTISIGEYSQISIFNYGEFVNEGKVELESKARFYNSGTVSNTGSFKNDGILATNDNEVDGVYSTTNTKQIVRTPLALENVHTAEDKDMGFTYKYGKEKYTFSKVWLKNYYDYSTFEVEYTDNDHAGTAKMKVTALETELYYYGEVEFEFRIYKGSVNISVDVGYSEIAEVAGSGNFMNVTVKASSSRNYITFPYGSKLVVADVTTLRFDDATLILSGELENHGTTIVSKAGIDLGGTVTNYGTFTVEFKYFKKSNVLYDIENAVSGTIENYGEFTNYSGITFADTSKIVNHEDGVLSFNYASDRVTYIQDLHFESADIENYGSIYADTDLYFDSVKNFVQEGTFVCQTGDAEMKVGCVYSKQPVEGITGNYLLQKPLSEVAELSYETVVYDGQSHKPSYTLEGQAITTDNIEVKIDFLDRFYSGYTDAGRMSVTLTVTKERKFAYYGTVTLYCEILKAEGEIHSSDELVDVINNGNYYAATLMADVEAVYNITLKNMTLNLNSYCVTIPSASNFIVGEGGLIINPAVDKPLSELTEKDCGIIAHGGVVYGKLRLSGGNLENYGVILLESNSFTYNGVSNLKNCGYIFAYEGSGDFALTSDSTGTVFRRETITEKMFALPEEQVDYDGAEHTPDVTFTGGVFLRYFSAKYSNNVKVGTATVEIATKNKLDQNYSGKVVLSFKINKAICNLRTIGADETTQSYIDYMTEAFGDDGYFRYVLSGNLTVATNFTVPAGKILDIAGYSIIFSGGTVTLENGAALYVGADSWDRLTQYMGIANRVYLLNDINTGGELNITSVTGATSNFKISGLSAVTDIEIDLAGHKILNTLKLTPSLKINLKIVDSSSDKSGIIGDINSSDYGVILSGSSSCKESYITLEGVRIAGLKTTGGYVTYHLSATDCEFVKAASIKTQGTVRIEKWNNGTCYTEFENCKISGAVGLFQENSTKSTFTDCQFIGLGAYEAKNSGIAILLTYAMASCTVTGGSITTEQPDGMGLVVYKDSGSFSNRNYHKTVSGGYTKYITSSAY